MAPSSSLLFFVTFFTSLETSAFCASLALQGFGPEPFKRLWEEFDLFFVFLVLGSENEALKTSSNVPHALDALSQGKFIACAIFASAERRLLT